MRAADSSSSPPPLYIYPLQWVEKLSATRDSYCEDRSTREEIIVIALDKYSNDICLRIKDFKPYFYISNDDYDLVKPILKTLKVSKITKTRRRPLYYYSKDASSYIMIEFDSNIDRVNAKYRLMKIKKNLLHEEVATSIQQLTAILNLPLSGGWISLKEYTEVIEEDRISSCSTEYIVKYNHLSPALAEEEEEQQQLSDPAIRIASWDIECYSSNPNKMPHADNLHDVVFQISVSFLDETQKQEDYILTIGEETNREVYSHKSNTMKCIFCKDEKELILGLSKLIKKLNPTVLIGYNIFRFDIPYLCQRAKSRACLQQFLDDQSYISEKPAEVENISWSSSAYGEQEYHVLKVCGRLYIDLYSIISKEYKFEDYKLDTVASAILKETKLDFAPSRIFKAWEDWRDKKKVNGLVECAQYCVKDSDLVLRLFQQLALWPSLTQMALISNVDIYSLLVRGQQIKTWSLLYRECVKKKIVVNCCAKDAMMMITNNDKESFQGAYVHTPEVGFYENVAVFDFQSLYPTSMIAYNIDYTTLIRDCEKYKYSPEDCHIIKWEEEEKQQLDEKNNNPTKTYEYYFYKQSKGLIPFILEQLLSKRIATKRQMKELALASSSAIAAAASTNSTAYQVLNKRQIAYKLCANSIYGTVSSSMGKCPCLPLGMCTTAIGRQSIKKVIAFFEAQFKDEVKVIYGDTDSVFCVFKPSLLQRVEAPFFDIEPPEVQCKALFNFCYSLEKKIATSGIFPEPIYLEFENIYAKFCILSKKRYIFTVANSDDDDSGGVVSKKIESKGVLLSRRDNAPIVKSIFRQVIEHIFYNFSGQDNNNIISTQKFVLDLIQSIPSHPDEEFSMTRKVSSLDSYKKKYHNFSREKQQMLIQELSLRQQLLNQKIDYKGCFCMKQCCTVCAEEQKLLHLITCPAWVQLAERMRKRGKIVESGERIRFIVTDGGGNPHESLYYKIEDIEYFKQFRSVFNIDYQYYIGVLATALDEILPLVMPDKKNIIKTYYNSHRKAELDKNKQIKRKIKFI